MGGSNKALASAVLNDKHKITTNKLINDKAMLKREKFMLIC